MLEIEDIMSVKKERNDRLIVYTSQYRYSGERRLNITAKEGCNLFRPGFEQVMEYKYSEQNAAAREKFENYYHELMQQCYEDYKDGWERLLEADWVVLVCYCTPHTFCHRYLLAEYLVKLGAEYKGEIPNV